MTRSRSSAGSLASIRVRAALAGGLVFGVAAGLTTASWVRAEYTGATFAASAFDVQTSVQGAAYTTASTVAVTAAGLYPSATLTSGNQYVSLKVRTDTTSVAGNVKLTAAANPATTGITPILRYRIVTIGAAATCSASSFTGSPTYVVGGAAAYQNVSAALPSSGTLSLLANAGSVGQYCIELSIPAGTAQTYAGGSGVLTLIVTGTST